VIHTLERRDGYRLQTGWGHVRVALFSDDALVSIRDTLRVLEANPGLTAEELLSRIQQHAAVREAAS